MIENQNVLPNENQNDVFLEFKHFLQSVPVQIKNYHYDALGYRHEVLGDLYEEVDEAIDELIELLIVTYDLKALESFTMIINSSATEPDITYLTEIVSEITEIREICAPHITTKLDDLSSLIMRKIFILKGI